jgi:putative membrane protein
MWEVDTIAGMSTAFSVFGTLLIFLAVLFHIYVFLLESLTWRKPKTWKVFGISSQDHADIIAPMALNQGFYNLFLAIGGGVGLVMLTINSVIALTLLAFACLSMAGAGMVLFFSVKTSRRAALIQAGPPMLGIVFLLIGRAL